MTIVVLVCRHLSNWTRQVCFFFFLFFNNTNKHKHKLLKSLFIWICFVLVVPNSNSSFRFQFFLFDMFLIGFFSTCLWFVTLCNIESTPVQYFGIYVVHSAKRNTVKQQSLIELVYSPAFYELNDCILMCFFSPCQKQERRIICNRLVIDCKGIDSYTSCKGSCGNLNPCLH